MQSFIQTLQYGPTYVTYNSRSIIQQYSWYKTRKVTRPFNVQSFIQMLQYRPTYVTYAPINVIPGEGGGRGILTFCPKFLSKTTPLGQCILSKNTKIPTQGQGSYVKCSYPEAILFILGIHCDQTRQQHCTFYTSHLN